MRKTAVFVLLAVCAVPLYARNRRFLSTGPAPPLVVERVTDPTMLSRLMDQAIAFRESNSGGLGTRSVALNSSTRAFAIPAAGSVRGGGGTFFRSDITLVNWNDASQKVGVVWYPNGASTPTVYSTTFPGNRPPFTTNDFVGTVIQQQGLGSLLFFPIDAAGNFDTNGAIDGYSRIWTNQPNATGTVSQPFMSVDIGHMMGEYEGILLGLRQDSSYRTNFGVVNMSDRALPFVITIVPESAPPGTTLTEVKVTVPAQAMVQQSLPAGSFGPINLLVNIDQNQPDTKFTWTAYASSTDNITGDGWVSIISKALDDDGLDTASSRRISK